MAHDRDHDHPPPQPASIGPREAPLASAPCPDRKRHEHPTVVPREPVDPKSHPSRRLEARLRARAA
jgi:hypothetical protein